MSTRVKITARSKRSPEFVVNDVKLRAYECGKLERFVDKWHPMTPRLGWNLVKGTIDNEGYLVCRLNRKNHKMHRLVNLAFNPSWDITDISVDNSIDHINGDKADNRIANLRVATHSQNHCNTKARSDNRTGLKNICPWYSKSGDVWYWRVRVNIQGKRHQSLFRAGDGRPPSVLPDVPQNVIDCRDEMLRKFHGKFARV